jgi:hypothetical protein
MNNWQKSPTGSEILGSKKWSGLEQLLELLETDNRISEEISYREAKSLVQAA